jgi:hypothetical protein
MNKETMADFEARMVADTLWLRAEFFRLVPCLTADEIAVLIDQAGEDPPATVTRWLAEARIFHVTRGPAEFYPAFQFGPDLSPLPIVGEVLKILRQVSSRSEWDNAMWFIAANGWLDGPSPLDVLCTEPDLVKDAAEQEVLPDIE